MFRSNLLFARRNDALTWWDNALGALQIGKWADYRYGELGYIYLSLFSKSLLALLVFGGTFQPDGDDDAR